MIVSLISGVFLLVLGLMIARLFLKLWEHPKCNRFSGIVFAHLLFGNAVF